MSQVAIKKMAISRILMTGGLLLITAALILTGYNLWDERRADGAAGKILAQLPLMTDEENMATQDQANPDYMINPAMDMPTVTIDGNAYVGILAIPALDLLLPVMGDWSYLKLKIAPCRYWGSAYTDDLIIAGHNYRSHFGALSALAAGDEVIFTDMDGNAFSYSVAEIEMLMGADVERMEAGNWDLTLFTCTLGGENRVTVRCERSGLPE